MPIITAAGGDGIATAKTIAMKVLIADDTDSVRYALRLVLEYLGHEVVGFATDGEEAIEKYRTMQPELVLMDVRMPLMDGLTCTSLLAKNNPNAKVVIVTGSRTTENEAREAGASGFVEKPFGVSELNNAINLAMAAA
jgi:two-component system chemotaxis response regulator CheY